MKKPYVTVIVPALNEEKSLGMVIANTLKSFDQLSLKGEVIVVNDGSRDNTRSIAEAFAARDNRVRLINHHKPHGIGASFIEGCNRARGDYVTMLPGDNENIPAETLKLIHTTKNYKVIAPYVANPAIRGLFRRSASRIFTLIVNLAFLNRFRYTNGTNIYRKDLFRTLSIKSRGFFYQTEILVKLHMQGVKIHQMPYRISERKFGDNKALCFNSLVKVLNDFLSLLAFKYLDIKGKKI
jgi:glycosyltransferase involved in cell wall biosynthesis